MLELVQKIFRMYSNLEISKIWIFVLDGRYLEEEEAEVVEVFPTSTTTTATYYWAASGSTDTTYASSGAELTESSIWWSTARHAWWIFKGPSPDVFSFHWSTRSGWLASSSGKATQHSIVWWPAEGVVRVRTTPRRSSRLVGGIWVRQCSSCHLAGV